MKIFLFCICLLLPAFGPREIGEGSAEPLTDPPDIAASDTLRYPMPGMNNTQKMLYWQNRPDVMHDMQSWRREQFRRHMGLAPEPEDPAYRQIPKTRSPFRQ